MDLTFVSLPQPSQAPRLEGASQAKLYMPAGAEASCWATGATLAVAAVTIFRAMRRRNWSRVSLGPSGGCFYDMKFRAKPGDKFKYRYSTDVWEPEWGIIPEEKGRLIRYGQRFRKGTLLPPLPGTGALLLDCDGTLAETERDGHRVAFNKAFEEKGFDVEWDVELYGELLTTGGGKERMTRYFKDYNPKAWIFEDRRSNAGFDKSMSALMCFDPPAKDHPVIMELHELKTRIFMEIVKSGDLPLREGIKDLISAADEAGAKLLALRGKSGWQLAVCSTSNEASVTAVVETMLPDFAPKMRIFAGDVVSAKKPDPAIYKLASEKLGVAPMRCVVIEDTSIGATAGNAAGMKVVVTKSVYTAKDLFKDADMVVENAAELDFRKDMVAKLSGWKIAT
eukprot:g5033.t1